jgi:hypothetical protein
MRGRGYKNATTGNMFTSSKFSDVSRAETVETISSRKQRTWAQLLNSRVLATAAAHAMPGVWSR